MEELSLDNILTGDEIDGLFSSPEDIQETEHSDDTTPPDTNKKKETELETTEVDPENLFDDGQLESVGSEDDNKGKEDTTPHNEVTTSPYFYSSIANALVEDGIFQNLDEEALSSIKSAEDFANVISEQIKSQFDERQKRVDEALNFGI